MTCAASVVLEAGMPDTSSEHAEYGTAAHELAAQWLDFQHNGAPLVEHPIGRKMSNGVAIDQEMLDGVQVYVDLVNTRREDYLAAGYSVDVHVEVRVPIGHLTGEDGATGTADVVIIADRPEGAVIEIIDLKFGRGVEVSGTGNHQLRIYALGALEEFGLVAEFTRSRMTISQPRVTRSPSEEELTIDELQDFGRAVEERAFKVREVLADPGDLLQSDYRPDDKACRWCKAKATCPALAAKVEQTTGADFEDLTKPIAPPQFMGTHADDDIELSHKMLMVDLVETWCKAVRAEAERRLLAGVPVQGFKLVQGKKGNRAWSDAEEAEKMLKAFRIKHDEMYDYKLISPTTAEKLAKSETIGKRQWPKLAPLITQAEGKPSVAPESDKRPALAPVAAAEGDFVDQTAEDLV